MRLAVVLLLLLSACAAPPLEEVPAYEPITDDSVYDPSAAAEPVIEPITSGPITSGPISSEPLDSGPVAAEPLAIDPVPAAPPAIDPVPAAPLSNKERLVAAIEGEGCVLNAENSERVLNNLGMGQEELARIGGELMQEGRVEVVPPAEFRLITGPCA